VRFLDHTLADFFDARTLPGALVYAALFVLVAGLISRLVSTLADRAVARGRNRLENVTAVKFVSQLAQVFIFLIAGILYAHLVPALQSLGTALLAGVSVVSVIVGLAAQSTLGNLISGIALLLYHPFRLGDEIQLTTPKGLETARIESLTLGYTVLRAGDQRLIIVPNSVIANAVIINLTGSRAAPTQPPTGSGGAGSTAP